MAAAASEKVRPLRRVEYDMSELLLLAFAGRARVRIQGSFAAGEFSEPEPDVELNVDDFLR